MSSLASLLERIGEAYKVLPPVAAVFFVFYTGPNKNAFRIVAVTFGIGLFIQLGQGAWDVARRTMGIQNCAHTC